MDAKELAWRRALHLEARRALHFRPSAGYGAALASWEKGALEKMGNYEPLLTIDYPYINHY